LYTSTSSAGDGIHKYSKNASGNWVSNGFAGLIGIEAIAATANGSNVTVYATDRFSIYRWTDSSGYNVPISGSVGASILTADADQTFRGLAFAPFNSVSPGLTGDYNGNGQVDAADYVLWRKFSGTTTPLQNDPIGGMIGPAQYQQWRSHF